MDGSRLLGCLLKTCGSETYVGCSSEKIDEKSIFSDETVLCG